MKVHIDPTHSQRVAIMLDQKIGPVSDKKDTPFVKHIRIKSEMLSKFWGKTDVSRRAHPLALRLRHASGRPLSADGLSRPLPGRHLRISYHAARFQSQADYSDRFHLAGYNRIQQKENYELYQKWISPDFPRFLVIEIQHANPYYDDSYAVNSANLGPYGDAINKELIPTIEKKSAGSARAGRVSPMADRPAAGKALATQVFYPDMYNGTFAACPDPIDFHAYTVVNLYADKNAYVLGGSAVSVERPALRNYMGEVFATQRDSNHMELVAGDHGRSGGQYDIWQAVFSPVGADGYPKAIFNKDTGEIDHNVASYWRDHYDLTTIIQRDWTTLGPKLAGKIHIYVGSGDSFYLNNAVYYAQDVLEKLKNPAYGGEVKYGDRAEHCWNGDPTLPNAYSRLHYDFQYLPKILARIQATAPKGADLTSWRY